MLFNSWTFLLLFFPLVLVLARLTGNWTARKSLLLVSSYVFYAAWNPPFVLLLWFSTVLDWIVARFLHGTRSPGRRKAWLVLSVVVNLGMLSWFKYGAFLVENLNALAAGVGASWRWDSWSVVLPVGISFYTFQTLSYTIDVYRGTLKPASSFLDYALFVTFFPQLVAGPIVRASDFLPRCREPKSGSAGQVGWGLCLLVIGLFAKVVLADTMAAPTVESVFDGEASPGFLAAWAGTLAFSMQIFYDFSGYSLCAVGAGLCLGFDLPDNFRYPYAARGFSDFWNRWHISLSTWLRDYLYLPLGGNRGGPGRTTLNLMTTMLLGGLWHGASWMFVIWGALHGLYIVLERRLRGGSLHRWPFWESTAGRLVLTLSTFLLVCIAWVFFRARDVPSAMALLGAMLDPGAAVEAAAGVLAGRPPWSAGECLVIGLLTAGTLVLHARLRDSSLEALFSRMASWARPVVLGVMAFMVFVAMGGGNDRSFIYFQL